MYEVAIHPQHVTVSLNGRQVDTGRLLAINDEAVLVEASGGVNHAPIAHAWRVVPGMRIDFAA